MGSAPFLRISAGLFSFLLQGLGAEGALGGFLSFLAGTFSPLPLFLVGLMEGAGAVFVAGAVASSLLLFFFGFNFSLVYGLMQGLPIGVFIYYLLLYREVGKKKEWYPEFLLLEKVVFLGLSVFILSWIFQKGIQGGDVQEKIAQGIGQSLEKALERSSLEGQARSQRMGALVYLVTHYSSVLLVFSWLLNMACNFGVAWVFLKKKKKSLRPSLEGKRLILPTSLLYIMALSSVGSFFGSGDVKIFLTSVALIVGSGYFINGLALAHRFLGTFRNKDFVRSLFYGGLLILMWPLVLLCLLGLLGAWVSPLIDRILKEKKGL